MVKVVGKKNNIKFAESLLKKLPFVQWDRYVDAWKEMDHLVFYGWIKRKDSYKDFVVIFVNKNSTYNWLTSSAELSNKISLLLGGTEDHHIGCERIEDLYPTLENVIKLKK